MPLNQNPWDALIPYVEAMPPEQWKRLAEWMSQPIIDWYLWIDESGQVHYAAEEETS